jgi:hypothetical protein
MKKRICIVFYLFYLFYIFIFNHTFIIANRVRGGVMVFFLKKILISNVAEKNILILVEEKKII